MLCQGAPSWADPNGPNPHRRLGTNADADADDGLDLDTDIKEPNVGSREAIAPDDLDDREKAWIADYRSLTDNLKSLSSVFVRRMAKSKTKAKRSQTRQYPPVDMDECRAMAERLRDEGSDWKPEDERQLQEEWAEDPLRKQPEELNVTTNRYFLPMWKITIQFLSCFPTTIVSPRNHLRYEASGRGAVEGDGGPNWSKSFCQRFKNLVLHGAFQLQPDLVALTLLYAAICREDYRGKIPWRNRTTDVFLDRLLRAMKVQTGDKSVVQVHQEVLSELTFTGKIPTSTMSMLFRRIEEIAFKRKEGDPFRPDRPPIFGIKTEDLATVTKAADAVKKAGVWLFLPVSIVSRAVKAAKNDQAGAPNNLKHLNELREAVILSDRRWAAAHDDDSDVQHSGEETELSQSPPRRRSQNRPASPHRRPSPSRPHSSHRSVFRETSVSRWDDEGMGWGGQDEDGEDEGGNMDEGTGTGTAGARPEEDKPEQERGVGSKRPYIGRTSPSRKLPQFKSEGMFGRTGIRRPFASGISSATTLGTFVQVKAEMEPCIIPPTVPIPKSGPAWIQIPQRFQPRETFDDWVGDGGWGVEVG
ncbi:hypothetical protein ABKA04_002317 [Annulohypoxylon sp. FPYF3050]